MVLDVTPLDPLVDAVFDVRTGRFVIAQPAGHFDKHPAGEGDGAIFTIIRMPRSRLNALDLDEYEVFDGPEDCPPITRQRHVPKKLDVVAHRARRKLVPHGSLLNVWTDPGLVAEPAGRRADYLAELKVWDTHLNASLTVGSGKTYATITAAIAAASSGDAVLVYAPAVAYDEHVDTVDKTLTMGGMVADQAITVAPTSGASPTFLIDNNAGVFYNLTADATGLTNQQGFYLDGHSGKLLACVGTGSDYDGFVLNCAGGGVVENCLAHNNGRHGFNQVRADNAIHHCTACKNTTTGFHHGADLYASACLAGGNGTDFATQIGKFSTLNCSEDASASGDGSVTGFATTDFTDYAGDDFTLKTSVAATTKARFDGVPWVTKDIRDQQRKLDSGIFFAGASDPDPVTIAVPTTPTFTVLDDGDGTNFTVTIDGDPGVTNYVKYRAPDGTSWTAGGNRAGDGDVKAAAGQGHYDVSVYSVSAAGVGSAWADIKDVFVRPSKSWTDEAGAGGGGSWTHET